MIKNFKKYNESINDDIDPYGEEDWNENEFQIGDKLLCVQNLNPYIKKDKIYVLVDIKKYPWSNSNNYLIGGSDDEKSGYFWYSDESFKRYFVKIKD